MGEKILVFAKENMIYIYQIRDILQNNGCIDIDEYPKKLVELKIYGSEHIQDILLTLNEKYLIYSTNSRVGCYFLDFIVTYLNYC